MGQREEREEREGEEGGERLEEGEALLQREER